MYTLLQHLFRQKNLVIYLFIKFLHHHFTQVSLGIYKCKLAQQQKYFDWQQIYNYVILRNTYNFYLITK